MIAISVNFSQMLLSFYASRWHRCKKQKYIYIVKYLHSWTEMLKNKDPDLIEVKYLTYINQMYEILLHF